MQIKATPTIGAGSSVVLTESAEAFVLSDPIEKDGRVLFPTGDVKIFAIPITSRRTSR